jgi:octaprenyl-diphosphate synthase
MTPPMNLLAPEDAVAMLAETARRAGLDGKVERRIERIQAAFADDLAAVERALADASARGAAPGIDAASHLVGSGGKRIRPVTVLLAAACFGVVPPAARELAIVAELVHSATLLHDDVIDDGVERRGMPTARRVYGNAVSVLAGDLLLTHALERTLAALPAALPDLVATLRRLVDGEIVQLRGRTEIDVSEPVYFRILEDKTASLFGFAARAGALAAGADEAERAALGRFGERLGIAFQLVDDALDYAGDPVETGKALFADLSEGKATLPVVLALGADASLAKELGAARGGDLDAARRLGAAVRALGVCDEVRRRASVETERAVRALDALPPSEAREMLAAVAHELTTRER